MQYVEFSVIGAESEALLSQLMAEGIKLRQIRNAENVLYVRVFPYYYPYIARLAREYRLRTRVTKRHGLRFSLYRYRRRYGVFIGAVLASVILITLSMFAWTIDIIGNDELTDNQLIQLLDSFNIRTGMLRSELNAEKIELLAPMQLEKLAWISVEFDGCRIVVRVQERSEGEVREVAQSSPCNIVATENALIVGADVYAGTLQANVGGGIKKGEIIIGGIVTDAAGNLLYNHAAGRIIGEYTVSEVFEAKYSTTEKTLSDNVCTQNHLILFGFDFPLYSEKYEGDNAVCTESRKNYVLFGVSLPWSVIGFTYTEYEDLQVTRGDDDLRRILSRQAELYKQSFLADVEVISFEESYSTDELGMRLEVTYMVRGEIGVEQEIFLNN